ncbi:hypothetical protein CROQUDRAFT_132923 [Cronartium quercuum f. sp. fusiforme G11]|uniref:CRAL-TRIO domain-containing protein n=1 Tax=Cronartium quercuum f. sp. fusiforme G11 TaxID=708437 RepID=A0A9P6NM95_9BASI|nr:hypothetical protein CROQUDRAFT_132923 [Cronartium quercuum f. sp. fusiforme G11]
MPIPNSLTSTSDLDTIQTIIHHLPKLIVLHQRSKNELLPSLSTSSHLSPQAQQLSAQFIDDKLNLFRFYKRSKFDIDNTLLTLSLTLQWRLNSSIHTISPSQIDPLYLRQPLFFFHPDLKDKWSRPCAILNLKHVCRSDDGSLDGLKQFIAWSWEIGRRYIQHTNSVTLDNLFAQPSTASQLEPSALQLQMVLMVDLKDATLNNLELELLPYFIDLLKNHYPGMVGTIYVLNYGWMYAGMWQVAKRVLPQSALDRIMFPNQKELSEFFEPAHLLVEHGGELVYEYDPTNNPIISQYHSQPTSSSFGDTSTSLTVAAAQPSPTLSRRSSAESLRELFFSAPTTPYPGTPIHHHHQRPSWLSMTTFNTGHHTPVVGRTHQHRHSLSVSKFGEAVAYNLAKQNRNRPGSFKLYLPQSHGVTSEYSSEDSTLTPTDSAPEEDVDEDDVKISISLPHTPWKNLDVRKSSVETWHARIDSASTNLLMIDNAIENPGQLILFFFPSTPSDPIILIYMFILLQNQ